MSPYWFPLIGLLVGVAAAFTGLGGGFLVVPLLIYLGFAPQKAVGTSFVAILIISLSAVFAHQRLVDVDWKAGLLLGVGGVAGAQLGARLLPHVDPKTFDRVFALLLIALAVKMLLRK